MAAASTSEDTGKDPHNPTSNCLEKRGPRDQYRPAGQVGPCKSVQYYGYVQDHEERRAGRSWEKKKLKGPCAWSKLAYGKAGGGPPPGPPGGKETATAGKKVGEEVPD